MPAYNKGNVIRGGFGSTFRLPARAQAGPSADRQGGSCVMGIGGNVFVIVSVGDGFYSATGDLRAAQRVSVRAKQRSKRHADMIFWRHIS